MKRSRFTEEQIIGELSEQEARVNTADVCCKHGVSEANVLQVEGQFRRSGCFRGPPAAAAGGQEQAAEEAGGRRDAGQCGVGRHVGLTKAHPLIEQFNRPTR
jgi:hypothetical protein